MRSRGLAYFQDWAIVAVVAALAGRLADRPPHRSRDLHRHPIVSGAVPIATTPPPSPAGGGDIRPAEGPSRPPAGGRIHRDIVYRVDGERRVALDIYLPEGPTPSRGWPVVVAIHGGGWRRLDKEEYGPTAAPLARYGYAVVAVEFLRSLPDRPGWPGILEDLRESIRWIRRHADEYGLDGARVAAMGESAGGHLAALLGTYPEGEVEAEGLPEGLEVRPADEGSARVQAVIDLFGPTDLVALNSQTPPPNRFIISQFLGGTIEQVPRRYEAASPIRHVSGDDPPMLLIHGTDDPYIPPGHSRALAEALTAVGVRNRLRIVEGGTHDKHGPAFLVGGRSLLPDILDFLGTWLE